MNIQQFITRSRRPVQTDAQAAQAEKLAIAKANAEQPQQRAALARIARHLGIASNNSSLD